MVNENLCVILDGLKAKLDKSHIDPWLFVSHFSLLNYFNKDEVAIITKDVASKRQITALLDMLKSKPNDCLVEIQKLATEHKWSEILQYIPTELHKFCFSRLIYRTDEDLILKEKPFTFDLKTPSKCFIGREQEIQSIHEVVSEYCGKKVTDRSFGSLVIHGLGGMGKTQLVLNYCNKYKDRFGSIIWIDAESEQTITASFQRLSDKMCINHDDLSLEMIQKVLAEKITSIGPKCLIIFDDAESIYKDNCSENNLCKKLPQKLLECCYFLITSRHSSWYGSKKLNISNLEEADATKLIGKILHKSEGAMEGASQLVSVLQGFPLALHQAAYFIKTENKYFGNYNCSKYLTTYRESTAKFSESTVQTWKVTFEKIMKLRFNDEDAETENLPSTILNISAFLCTENIPTGIFTKIAKNKQHLHWAMKTLQSFSMVSVDSGKMKIHRLVQETIRSNLFKNNQSESVIQLAAELLVNYSENENLLPLSTQKTLLLQLLELKSNTRKETVLNSNDFEHLYECIMRKCCNFEDPKNKITLSEEMISSIEKQLGDHNIAIVYPLVHLANAHGCLGDVQTKKYFLERALIIQEQHYGHHHFELEKTLENLGDVYGYLGDPLMEKNLLERTLKIKEEQHGNDHIDVAKTLGNLGNAYGSLGYPQMEKMFQERALKIKEQHYGPDHIKVGETLGYLGNAFGSLGEPQMEKMLQERSLKIKEQHFGPDHIEVAKTLGTLANAYGSLGEPHMEKSLLERALIIKEKYFGPNHIEVAKTLGNLANANGSLCDPQMEKTLLERVLKIKELHYGPDHLEVARTLVNLGNAWSSLGYPQMQITLLERALKIKEKHGDTDSLEVAKTMRNLGIANGVLNDHISEKQLLERALSIYESHYGSHNYQTAFTQERLVYSLTNLGRKRMQNRCWKRCLLFIKHIMVTITWKKKDRK